MRTLYRINWLAATDGDAVTAWLNRMARKGWHLRQAGDAVWQFEKGEATEAQYAVAYFPEASVYNGVLTWKQKEYLEYCEAAGWQFVGQWKRMQIFLAQHPDAVPLETEPAQKLETIQAAMKPFRRSTFVMIAISIIQMALLAWSWHVDPLAVLASPFVLVRLSCWPFLLLIEITDIVLWRRWLTQSKRSIAQGGDCVQSAFPLARRVEMGALVIVLLELFQGLWYASRSQSWGLILLTPCIMLGIFLAMRLYMQHQRRKGYPDKVIKENLWFFAVVVCIVVSIYIFARPRFQEIKPDYYYTTSSGTRYSIFTDKVPVTMEELGIEATDIPLSSYLSGDSMSPLAGYTAFWLTQWRLGDTPNELYCIICRIPWRWLRETVILPRVQENQRSWQDLYVWNNYIMLLSADTPLTEAQTETIQRGVMDWYNS